MITLQIQNFELSEFDSPDVPGSGAAMNFGTLKKVGQIREGYGKAMKITSGYRTKAHNNSLKHSAKNSSHLFGFAVDISCPDDADMIRLIELAFAAKIRRFGIMNGALHIDDDPTKPNSIWGYGNEQTPRFAKAVKKHSELLRGGK